MVIIIKYYFLYVKCEDLTPITTTPITLLAALEDDCTRLTYLEILKDKKASTLTYFMARALSWFKQIYTRPYRPQTNGKVEAFWKIIKNEFFYPNSFDSVKDLIYN
ncbi:integrase core domain-containing protein, partial [bacterium]|nr:integrase core domain-containing protein [bacterium]